MTLTVAQLCQVLEPCELRGSADLSISGVTADSRQAGAEVAFVAVKGTHADGHQYLEVAVAGGCQVAVVESSALSVLAPNLLAQLKSLIVVKNTRSSPALLARALAGNPEAKLFTAGVTGTNGKTTVASLLQCVLDQLQGPCGLLGTIRYQAGTYVEAAPLTTPGGPELYAWLGRMAEAGCRSVALELSSHALVQQRAAGLPLDLAIMTNLGRDHLDYHAGLADYLAAKVKILDMLRPCTGVGVINADDPALAPLLRERSDCVGFSASGRPVVGSEADLLVKDCLLDLHGTTLAMTWRGEALSLRSPLVGRYNVENLAAALTAMLAAGFPGAKAVAALENLAQVPGRMERFVLPNGALAVVDYAHTADALTAVLTACRELTPRRVLVVFGCGGDRDRGKRPLMGVAAAKSADLVWITADNPRSEDPRQINLEIAKGVNSVGSAAAMFCHQVEDRTEAICEALAAAEPEDVVVIAGKGHEDYQLVGDKVLHLDDRLIVKDWIQAAGGKNGS